ncbi:MAG TPA: cupredoxin domain-containing protein [Candidatus Binataceae bacterium]|nr:cupredoxin domain-containing protein [Candidatus Binataceae bacterium]
MRAKLTAAVSTVAMIVMLGASASALFADDSPEIRFQGGRFEPAVLTLPVNTPTKLRVVNAGDAAIEFESFELNRERVVQPGQAITVYIPALGSGSYGFFDDLHHAVPAGKIVVR